eukprot:TRINITY_DN5036_c0_g1_i1.p1 TRINITY_DN5036_c0_g1~~TRINITY_DN5036_c0_g1_i1.p1  ORF type:complete len:324 (+),score=88.63 TRINITY_DN5036_c0_g1_i1:81-974(+)
MPQHTDCAGTTSPARSPPPLSAVSAVCADSVRSLVCDDSPRSVPADALRSLRQEISKLQDDKLHLYRQLESQNRDIAIQKHRIDELEQALARALAGGLSPQRAPGPPERAAPEAAPPVTVARAYDRELCGTGVIMTEDSGSDPRPVTCRHVHQYNKLCLCGPGADAVEGGYAEFVLDGPFPRFTSVGVLLEKGLPRLNLNTDALGEHDFSYSWNGHKYWTASLLHNGQSKGPRGGSWKPGSRIGVLVRDGSVSYYLDGELSLAHAFNGLSGSFRFAVGFGGPAEEGSFGQVTVVQPR